jgi:queuine tRNA-ribosyltransferase
VRFQVVANDGQARRGLLTLPHGEVETPAFMPVATLGSVKGVTPQALEMAGAGILLSNLYHLALRPGIETIVELGGLRDFVGWAGPMLTDSGGFQVFSLAKLNKVDAGGVRFRSHIDGSELHMTPETVVDMQRRLGVDIAMMLDECPPWPVSREKAAAALERTNGWAQRAREAWSGGPSALFGILQGGVFPDLRELAARELSELDFDGYAIGGVSVGEPVRERRTVVELATPMLPTTKPRYLMGLGTPLDILHAVRQGTDLFDCVLPSRNGRHGVVFTRGGLLRLKNARFRRDSSPLDPECRCPACTRVGRAFLHHLVRAGELTGAVLATLHNLQFYLDFMTDVRDAIASGNLAELEKKLAAGYADEDSSEETPRSSNHLVQLP